MKIILRFGIVGIINTLIDYSIFQFLVYIFDVKSLLFIFGINCISSGVAVINSYIMNKKWTFKDPSKNHVKLFSIFVIVNIVGIIINSTTVTLLTFIVPFQLHIVHWNIRSLLFTKVIAIIVTMFYNFITYKKIVFTNASVYNPIS